ncbi:hypothetical protein ACFO5K_03585 [Nocardia halotolerans]|uniref:Small secreted domain n=1 Tax=Nocardia halotolerans TaxID=1755878 RepID=A0ABV8VCF9_9NOCA
MFAKTARPLAVVAAALFVTALGAGTASAATDSAATAQPIVGSVAICAGIPVGPITISVCL